MIPKHVSSTPRESICKSLRFGLLQFHINTSHDNDPAVLVAALDKRFGPAERQLSTFSPTLRWSFGKETIVVTPDDNGESADVMVAMEPN